MRLTLEQAQHLLRVVLEKKKTTQLVLDFDGSGKEIRSSFKVDLSCEEFKLLGDAHSSKSENHRA